MDGAQQRSEAGRRRAERERRKRMRRRRRILFLVCWFVILIVFLVKIVQMVFFSSPAAEEVMVTETQQQEQSQSQSVVITAEDGLNVREGAGTDQDKVATFSGGIIIEIGEEQDNWAELAAGDYQGNWICTDYIAEVKEVDKSGTIASSTGTIVYLRKGPASDFDTLTRVPDGTEVQATASAKVDGDTWYQITYDDMTGWILASYVK